MLTQPPDRPSPPSRLYLYVDESGQDTGADRHPLGPFFVVAVVLADRPVPAAGGLADLEASSGKRRPKWKQNRDPEVRAAYLHGLAAIPGIRLFAWVHRGLVDSYVEARVEAVCYAVRAWGETERNLVVRVDGLERGEAQDFGRRLRAKGCHAAGARGGRDEGTPLLRAADALAGAAREVLLPRSVPDPAFQVELDRLQRLGRLILQESGSAAP